MLSEYDSTVIKIDTMKNKVDMISYFTLGRYYEYSEIRIEKNGEGEPYVSDELIKYLSNINPGDTYKEDELFKSRVRLARTGLARARNRTRTGLARTRNTGRTTNRADRATAGRADRAERTSRLA